MGAYFRSALLDWELIRRSWGLNRGNTVNTKKVDLSYTRTIRVKHHHHHHFQGRSQGCNSAINSATFVTIDNFTQNIFSSSQLNWVIIHII